MVGYMQADKWHLNISLEKNEDQTTYLFLSAYQWFEFKPQELMLAKLIQREKTGYQVTIESEEDLKNQSSVKQGQSSPEGLETKNYKTVFTVG